VQRRQFLGSLLALAVVPRVRSAVPPEAGLTPLEEAAEQVRYWRRRMIAADAGGAVPEFIAREGASPIRKLLGAIGELRNVTAREGLSPEQYRRVLRLSIRLAHRDYLALNGAQGRSAAAVQLL